MFQWVGDILDKVIGWLAYWLNRAGVFSILAMMALTVIDVSGRYFFNKPIAGVYELTEFMLVIAVASGLAYTQISKRHVSVELMVSRLSPKAQKIVYCLGYTLCVGVYVLIAWQTVRGAQNQARHAIISAAFGLPLWPFYVFLAFGCGVLCLVFFSDFLKVLRDREERS